MCSRPPGDKVVVMEGSESLPLNDPFWFRGSVDLEMDRLETYTVMCALILTLKHPGVEKSAGRDIRRIARKMAAGLFNEGLAVPPALGQEFARYLGIIE